MARRAGIPVIGVEFGYTDVPIAELKPGRQLYVELLLLEREQLDDRALDLSTAPARGGRA